MNNSFDLANYANLAAIQNAEVSPMVTPSSRWSEDIWRLEGNIPGTYDAQFSIYFDVNAHRQTIDEMKWLAARLFVGRYGQRTFKHSTAGAFSSGMRHLAVYMKMNNHRSFASLKKSAYDDFADTIHKDLVTLDRKSTSDEQEGATSLDELQLADGLEPIPHSPEDDDTDGGVAKAYNRLRIWKLLWDHRHEMEEAGIKPIQFNPFVSTTPTAEARTLAAKAAGEIPALPDEMALPVLAGAIRLIGQPATDVIDLQTRYIATMERMDREPPTAERVKLKALLEGFEFSTLKDEQGPWRERFVLGPDEAGGGDKLADLLEAIRAACLIVLMGFTGVRISEAVSPEVDDRMVIDDVPPSCITIEGSKSGLSNLYMLHGLLSKTQERPTPETWLMGSRPVLAGSEPATVRAVRVLELLYQPWRRFASDPLARRRLFLGFMSRGLPRDAGSVIPVSSERLRLDMQAFVANAAYVDLSGLREGARSNPMLKLYADDPGIIRTHQWRKTFMRYAMRTDPKMAPAVSQQFKHYTVALTERDYGPKDASFLEQADSLQARSTGVALRSIIEGKKRPVARLDKGIARWKEQWRKLLPEGHEPDDAGFTALAINEDLRIWYSEHGRCLVGLQPDEARCHDRAGTNGWRHARPNHLTRTPSLCTGCANFSVNLSAIPFWRRRYVENQQAFVDANGEPGFEIIRRRAETAAKFLRALGEEPPVIERKSK
jgi:integrase